MTREEMRIRKTELGLTYHQIAEKSGIPVSTVQKVLEGYTRSPRYEVIVALEQVLGRGTAVSYGDSYPLLPGKHQGEYTAEDRDLLPEDVRTELIDGVLYDMASPRLIHQQVLLNIVYQLQEHIDRCGKECLVVMAPHDVWLTKDNKNIFQPDIYVLCDISMIGEDGYTKGAPPFVIEILSKSTRRKDMLLKAYKYGEAGVREYWIVDPETEKVTVHLYEKEPGEEMKTYSFDDAVPVGISGGKCSVDFRRVRMALEKLQRT
ncbi:MAG: Uma2 family endonuclease [Clostridium sp.]|nr:Uma2 family endonuclease [Clostridium sp.]